MKIYCKLLSAIVQWNNKSGFIISDDNSDLLKLSLGFIQILVILNYRNYYFNRLRSSEIYVLNRSHKTELQLSSWKWYNYKMIWSHFKGLLSMAILAH